MIAESDLQFLHAAAYDDGDEPAGPIQRKLRDLYHKLRCEKLEIELGVQSDKAEEDDDD